MPICWTRAARSRLLVLAAPVFVAAACARVAHSAGASSSFLWEARPHTVPVSPFTLKHEGMRAELAALLALTLSEADLSAEAKAWLGSASALAPGYGGDFLVLQPEGEGRFRVERRISPVEP